MNDFPALVQDMQTLLTVCPCCMEVFRVVEGTFVFPKRRTRPNEFSDLIAAETQAADALGTIEAAEDRFDDKLARQRATLRAAGRRRAKDRLREFDYAFSKQRVDPQDVKVIFHPIEFVVFRGLTAGCVSSVELVGFAPRSREQETSSRQIEVAVKSGAVAFEVLRLRPNGTFDIQSSAGGHSGAS